MANEVKFIIDVEAGSAKGNIRAVKGELDEVDKSAKKTGDAVKKSGKDINDSSKLAAKGLSDLGGSLSMIPGPIGAITRGIQSKITAVKTLTGTTNLLRLALIALPFVAIGVAIATLVKAFASTQEGADRINRVLVPMREIMNTLWGVAQDLSIAIVDAFTNPQEAVKGLWNVIKTQIMNRITAVIDGFGALGRAIKSVVTLDMEGLKQAGKDFGEAYIQAITGVEDAVEKGRQAYQGVNAVVDEAIERGERIQEIEEEIRQLRIDQAVPLARLRREFQEQLTISRDTTKSHEEQLAASRRAIELRQQLRDEEMKVLDLQIEQLELRHKANDTRDDEKLQLQQLIAQREELATAAERETSRVQVRMQQTLKSIEDGQEAEEEAQRIYIDGLNNRANEFRNLLKTEKQLQKEAFDEMIAQVNFLIAEKVLSEEEGIAIIAQLRKESNEDEINEALAVMNRLQEIQQTEEEQLQEKYNRDLEKLQLLHENELISIREFNTLKEQLEAEHLERLNEMHAEQGELQRMRTAAQLRSHSESLQEMLLNEELTAKERSRIEAELAATRKAHIWAVTGEAIAAGIENANTAKEFGREVIRVIAREAGAYAATSVYRAVPFPFNIAAAPIAGALAKRLVMSFANFNTGGLVGARFGQRGNFGKGDNRLIAANDREVILNPEQQARLGGAPAMAMAGVPGFPSSGLMAMNRMSLDTSGFERAVSNMPERINVVIDLDEVVRKVEDKQRVNRERLIIQ